MSPDASPKKSFFASAFGAVKDAALNAVENASSHTQSVDSAATSMSAGFGAALAGGSMFPVTIAQRPAVDVPAARTIDEVAAGLPPASVLSTVQMSARANGWDADGEVVFGDSQLEGFALRHAVDNAAMKAVTMFAMASGGDSESIADRITLFSAQSQELMTLHCGHINAEVTLPSGEVIATLKRSTAKKNYMLHGVGPLEGLVLRGEPRYRVSNQRNSAARLRAQRETTEVEQWHPWVSEDLRFVVDPREMSSGPYTMAQIEVNDLGDSRLAVLAWAATLDYWYTIER